MRMNVHLLSLSRVCKQRIEGQWREGERGGNIRRGMELEEDAAEEKEN